MSHRGLGSRLTLSMFGPKQGGGIRRDKQNAILQKAPTEGESVGVSVVGVSTGELDGSGVGSGVGAAVGFADGISVGFTVGSFVVGTG